jgi:hypothetical protein
MRKNRMEVSDLRSYDAPRIVQVGTVAAFTVGYGSSEVTDPPHDGASGWYNLKDPPGVEVDLGAA